MKFSLIIFLMFIFTSYSEVNTLMANKGKLLFNDQCDTPRGKKNSKINNNWKVRAGLGKWDQKDGFHQSSWKKEMGHTPVMAFDGKFKNIIIEVTFRYNNMTEPWHTQCFRIAMDNKSLYTGHVLSAWANPNNDFIETGFLLQHISKKADKTIIDDILLDKQPLNVKVGVWHTAILEVVGNKALFHMDGNLAYAESEKINVDKTLFNLTLGKTIHDVKSVKAWEATLKDDWYKKKTNILKRRQDFNPQPHKYSKPIPAKK
jgi:hypothetical protein